MRTPVIPSDKGEAIKSIEISRLAVFCGRILKFLWWVEVFFAANSQSLVVNCGEI